MTRTLLTIGRPDFDVGIHALDFLRVVDPFGLRCDWLFIGDAKVHLQMQTTGSFVTLWPGLPGCAVDSLLHGRSQPLILQQHLEVNVVTWHSELEMQERTRPGMPLQLGWW